MAVEALISSSPLAHGSPRPVTQVTPFPEGPWRPGVLCFLLDDDNAFWSSWWLLFGLLALAFVRCPGLPRGDLGGQFADHTLQLLNRPSLASFIAGEGTRNGCRSRGSVASFGFARAWIFLGTSLSDACA